jgi:hypothetical protein
VLLKCLIFFLKVRESQFMNSFGQLEIGNWSCLVLSSHELQGRRQVGGGERGEESRKTLKSSPNARFFYSILPDFSCLFPFGVL